MSLEIYCPVSCLLDRLHCYVSYFYIKMQSNSGDITSINVFSALHNTLCLCKITTQVYNNTIPAVETDPKEIYFALILHLEFV